MMNLKNLQTVSKFIGVAVLIIVIFIIVGYFILGEIFGNPLRLRYVVLGLHQASIEEFIRDVAQKGHIHGYAHTAKFTALNNCTLEGKDEMVVDETVLWKCSKGHTYNEYDEFQTTDAMLAHLQISNEEYSSLKTFMERYHLDSYGYDFEHGYIELSDTSEFIRYFMKPNPKEIIFHDDPIMDDYGVIDAHWMHFSIKG
jgi:hypothetical protein